MSDPITTLTAIGLALCAQINERWPNFGKCTRMDLAMAAPETRLALGVSLNNDRPFPNPAPYRLAVECRFGWGFLDRYQNQPECTRPGACDLAMTTAFPDLGEARIELYLCPWEKEPTS